MYNVVTVPAGLKSDQLDFRPVNGYTDSCTIKVGQPCQLASVTAADFPSHLQPHFAGGKSARCLSYQELQIFVYKYL
jgi:hypothetical protein